MHDTQMDSPDICRVVVQKSNNAILELAVDLDFLVHFSLNTCPIGLLIRRKERFVSFVHVTADPDRPFCDQALFAGFFSTHVINDAVPKCDERVGNDLLVGWIPLSLSTRKKEIISA